MEFVIIVVWLLVSDDVITNCRRTSFKFGESEVAEYGQRERCFREGGGVVTVTDDK